MAESNTNIIVFAHPDVIAEGLIGYVRCTADGDLEFHASIDTVGAELQRVPLVPFLERDPSIASVTGLQPSQHGWRWEPNAEFSIARIPEGDTHYIQATVMPNNDHPEFSEIESAMIECWVRCPLAADAIRIVRESLRSENWDIQRIDGPETHTEDDYVDEPEFLQYCEQVQTDGEVFVYHIIRHEDAR